MEEASEEYDRPYPMDPYYEVRLLRAEVARLRARNAELFRENGEYLANWIQAQDRSSNQMVMALLAQADPGARS